MSKESPRTARQTSFADTLFTPDKWEWLTKLKEQVSVDMSEKEEQPKSSGGGLTENLFSPEKWEWVVALNQQMRDVEQRTGPERLTEEPCLKGGQTTGSNGGGLTNNIFSPEKWEWVVTLNQQMRAMEKQTGPEKLIET